MIITLRKHLFKNTLFLKIILVFTLPAIGMMYFSTVLVYEKIETLGSVKNIRTNIKYLYHAKRFIDTIEQERTQTILYLLHANKIEKLHKSIENTNHYYQLFLEKSALFAQENQGIIVNVKTIQQLFYNLKLLREEVQNNQNHYDTVLTAYSKLNEFLIATLNSIKPINFATKFNTKIHYLTDLITLKEYAHIENDLLTIIANKQTIDKQLYNMLVENETTQDIHLKKFLLNANIQEINKYSDEISLSLLNKIQKIRQQVQSQQNITRSVLPIFEQKVDSLQKVYDFVYVQLQQMGDELEKEASLEQLLSLSFLFVSFVTLISLLFVLKNIIFNEQKSYNKITKQQEVYKLLSATNNYLLTTTDEKQLYKEICKLISLTTSMSFGFIYKIGKSKKMLIAQEGELKNILDIKLQEKENRINLISRAIEKNGNIIVNSFQKEHISILSDVAQEYELRSAGAFPIRRFDKIVAVMVLYSNEYNFFDTEIEILFNNMISDMTHSLEKLKYEKAQIEHQHELKIAAYAFESNTPMIITNQSAHIIKVNQAFCNVMGYSKEEIIGRNPNMFKSKHHDKTYYAKLWEELNNKGTWTGEIYNTKKNKELIPLRSAITAIKNSKGVITHYLAQYVDISEHIDRQKVLEYQATHDNLTGLPNRLLLMDRIERAITKVERHQLVGGLIFIDLDNFKQINDTLGHEIGDKLLIMVAQKIKQTIRKEDTIARIGGDEFIILADHIGNTKEEAYQNMQHLTQKIKLSLNSIIEIDGHKNISTPSIGVTLFSDSSISIQDIIKQADTAMYAAKKQGKNSIEFFN